MKHEQKQTLHAKCRIEIVYHLATSIYGCY